MTKYEKHYRLDTNEELDVVCHDCPPLPGNHLNPARPMFDPIYKEPNGKEFHLAEVKEKKVKVMARCPICERDTDLEKFGAHDNDIGYCEVTICLRCAKNIMKTFYAEDIDSLVYLFRIDEEGEPL